MGDDLIFGHDKPELRCPRCGGWMRFGEDGGWHCAACAERDAQGGPNAGAATGPAKGPPSATAHRPIGRPRRFWACFGLGIVTLGLYFLYYNGRVFWEVARSEGRASWLPLYAVAGLWTTLLALSQVRGDLLVELGAGVVAATAGAAALVEAAYFVLACRTLNFGLAARGAEQRMPVWALPFVRLAGTAAALAGLPTIVVVAVLVPLALLVYVLLQSNLNAYWTAWQQDAGRSTAA